MTRAGPLAVLTMDAPPANLFDEPMWAAWTAAVEHLTDHPPRALLIRAEGRVVSAGVDVRVFADLPPDGSARFWAAQLRITQLLERLPGPTVFAAHSLTLTAAFELALACDLIVAPAAARFGLVERKVAFTPAMGGTQRLAQRAGPARAKELVLTGGLYRADRLAEWGVVNRILAQPTFHRDAFAFAMGLATGPTRAHAATKRVVQAFVSGGVAAADSLVPSLAGELSATEDHRRAVQGFLADGPKHGTSYLGC